MKVIPLKSQLLQLSNAMIFANKREAFGFQPLYTIDNQVLADLDANDVDEWYELFRIGIFLFSGYNNLKSNS